MAFDIVRVAFGSAQSYDNDYNLNEYNDPLSTNLEFIGNMRSGTHQCAPGICCPQFLTCLWGWTKFYCCYKPYGKWTRKMPAFSC